MFSSHKFTTTVSAVVMVALGCSSGGVAPPTPSASPVVAPSATAVQKPAVTPTVTPAAVAVLPGDQWIVFGWTKEPGGWYLALMRPDGSDFHEIAGDVPGEQKRPVWSPDGTTLAFVVTDADSLRDDLDRQCRRNGAHCCRVAESSVGWPVPSSSYAPDGQSCTRLLSRRRPRVDRGHGSEDKVHPATRHVLCSGASRQRADVVSGRDDARLRYPALGPRANHSTGQLSLSSRWPVAKCSGSLHQTHSWPIRTGARTVACSS